MLPPPLYADTLELLLSEDNHIFGILDNHHDVKMDVSKGNNRFLDKVYVKARVRARWNQSGKGTNGAKSANVSLCLLLSRMNDLGGVNEADDRCTAPHLSRAQAPTSPSTSHKRISAPSVSLRSSPCVRVDVSRSEEEARWSRMKLFFLPSVSAGAQM